MAYRGPSGRLFVTRESGRPELTTGIQPHRGSYLTPCFEHATVADAMRTGVMSCPHDVPATTVARIMATHHIHSVVVEAAHSDPVHGERLKWGVVSDMDLLRRARGDRRHDGG
jgi:hypothetical protein